MLDETFAEALVHRRVSVSARFRARLTNKAWSGHKILGVRLRPFSYWCAFCLDAIKSPFAGHRRVKAEAAHAAGSTSQPLNSSTSQLLPDIADVVLAINACRAWYPHFPFPTGLGFKALRWRARLSYSLGSAAAAKPLRLRSVAPNFELPREAAHVLAFYKYLSDYNSVPVFGESEDSQPVNSPWYLFAILSRIRLHNELGLLPKLTLAEAWNTPIGYGAWASAAMLEATGGKIDILTPELRAAFAEAKIPIN